MTDSASERQIAMTVYRPGRPSVTFNVNPAEVARVGDEVELYGAVSLKVSKVVWLYHDGPTRVSIDVA